MAELAALGLASNIVQFIDFGLTLFHEGKELYDSDEGGSAQRLELETVTEDLNDIAQELQQGALPANKGDAALRKLGADCEKLAKELLGILDKLKVKDGQNRKWASFKQAVKGMVKDGKIRNIEARLQKYREQLGERLLYILSDQNSTVLSTIQDLQGENRRLSANTMQKLNEIRETLLKQVSDGDFARVEKQLKALVEEGEHVKKQQKILRSLWFQDLKLRQDTIKEAHAKTFRWIFQSQESNFSKWLQAGHGIYWIQGKAGSGKSTLLRYLSGHYQTRSILQDWASEFQLVIGSHFFWNAGNSMQKSQQGLLRTLLYQVFRQCPDMIQQACKHRWNGVTFKAEPWTRDELLATFDELSQNTLSSARFCFFVDGLDEYSGRAHDANNQEVTHEQREHQELVTVLDRLSKTESFKFCVSSRPWNIFQYAYGESVNKLKLEDLTRNDIRNYVRIVLEENAKFKKLQCQELDRNSIVEVIVTRAHGVFLWVCLVVSSLLRGLIEGDNILGLKKRLNAFPSDLENFFKHMITNIDPVYRDDTIRFFEAAVNALQPLPVLAFRLLEDEKLDQDYALRAPIEPYSISKIDNIRDNMKIRLNARCRDLLEVTEDFSESKCMMLRYKVDFLHRTVRDFFLTTKLLDQMKQGRQDFDVRVSLCRIMVALTKSLPTEEGPILVHMLSLTDELLFHARNIELHCDDKGREFRYLNEVKLLDELDRVNCEHTKTMNGHWSNLRSAPKGLFMEFNERSFLAMAVQAKLTMYVRRKLDPPRQAKAKPGMPILAKPGRPLLDYALRPHMITPIELPDYDSRPDPEMVGFLLDQGANPNECIFIYKNQTVWSLFLQLCHEKTDYPSDEESRISYSVVDLLLRKGADPKLTFESNGKVITVADALHFHLTLEDSNTLEQLLVQKRRNYYEFWKYFGLG